MASYGHYYGGLYPQNSTLYSARLRDAIRRRTRNALVNNQAIHDREQDPAERDDVPLLKSTGDETTKHRLPFTTTARKLTEKKLARKAQLPDTRNPPVRPKRARRSSSSATRTQTARLPPAPIHPPVLPSTITTHQTPPTAHRLRHKPGRTTLRSASQPPASTIAAPSRVRFDSATELLSPPQPQQLRPRPLLDWTSQVRSEFDADSDDVSTVVRGGMIGDALRRTLLCRGGRLCVGG